MIDFLRYKWLYFLISLTLISIGLFSIVRYGFKLSIDFVGGSLIEYRLEGEVDRDEFKKIFEEKGIELSSVQKSAERIYLLRSTPIDEKEEGQIRKELEEKYQTEIETLRFETVGPILGRETRDKTIVAVLIATVGILLYVAFVFKNFKYGMAAVLAMFHDFLILVGLYSLLSHVLGAEVDTLFVTAVLTTMSFSVHDTIVVFDKIREYQKKEGEEQLTVLINKALTETMVRSINNSITIVLMLFPLILIGGETIRFFIIALLIGTLAGTYSSPFVAAPILQILEKKDSRR